jgi:hypothetical protein
MSIAPDSEMRAIAEIRRALYEEWRAQGHETEEEHGSQRHKKPATGWREFAAQVDPARGALAGSMNEEAIGGQQEPESEGERPSWLERL